MAKLKRELGLLETTLAGVGIIIGVGIYVLIGEAASLTGNSIWLSFAVGAVVAILTGLSYAELSSMFPRAGAESVYTEKTFGRTWAFVIGWMIIVGGSFSAATVTLGFAGYFNDFFGTDILLVAIALTLVLSFINFWGIKESAWLAVAFTIVESIGLLIIIAIGLPQFGKSGIDYLAMPNGIGGMLQAAVLVFFAYLGFESITRLAEETKNAERTIPKAIVLSVLISAVLYILVAVSAVSVVGWEKLAGNPAPLALVARTALGANAYVVLTFIALFAAANTALLMLITDSRIIYGMADTGLLPRQLAIVHRWRKTPVAAILVAMILALGAISIGDIAIVANVTNFTVFITFITINLAVIWLRYDRPDATRRFKIPLNVGRFPTLPLFGAFSCVFMITTFPIEVIVGGFMLILLGLIFHAATSRCWARKNKECRIK
ncbi:MAG: APC family permease [Candidatus Micrarchaeia archaeon]